MTCRYLFPLQKKIEKECSKIKEIQSLLCIPETRKRGGPVEIYDFYRWTEIDFNHSPVHVSLGGIVFC